MHWEELVDSLEPFMSTSIISGSAIGLFPFFVGDGGKNEESFVCLESSVSACFDLFLADLGARLGGGGVQCS